MSWVSSEKKVTQFSLKTTMPYSDAHVCLLNLQALDKEGVNDRTVSSFRADCQQKALCATGMGTSLLF